MVGQEIELLAAQGASDEMHAYERLIGDALQGDAALFAREDGGGGMAHRGSDSDLRAEPPIEYQPGSWGPAEASRLIEASGGWHKPRPAATKTRS